VRIAILGTRGIPANYGGFETFAEELGARLAARGHEVTVYGRSHYVPPDLRDYRGMRLVVLPTIRHKYFDTVVHTALSAIDALARRFDVALVCNAANAPVAAWPRLAGTRVVLNVDGIERRRRKWNAAGRAWYRMCERVATWTPHAVVTDARAVQTYYRERYRTETTFIPYGGDLPQPTGTATLERLGLTPRDYLLYVSRLEPENNADAVIAGYNESGVRMPLVVVGDAPYASDYIARLRRMAGPGVRFTGAVYGEGYRELQSYAFAYLHATEVGGTHPALVEALAFGNCAIVNDVAENREVAGDAALYFSASAPSTLAAVLRRVASEPGTVETLRARAGARAREQFSWDRVTDQYEALFRRLVGTTD
jgi:glycosyltransferase involved in cell wall biosynthesis